MDNTTEKYMGSSFSLSLEGEIYDVSNLSSRRQSFSSLYPKTDEFFPDLLDQQASFQPNYQGRRYSDSLSKIGWIIEFVTEHAGEELPSETQPSEPVVSVEEKSEHPPHLGGTRNATGRMEVVPGRKVRYCGGSKSNPLTKNQLAVKDERISELAKQLEKQQAADPALSIEERHGQERRIMEERHVEEVNNEHRRQVEHGEVHGPPRPTWFKFLSQLRVINQKPPK